MPRRKRHRRRRGRYAEHLRNQVRRLEGDDAALDRLFSTANPMDLLAANLEAREQRGEG